jgi:hypothetical protein
MIKNFSLFGVLICLLVLTYVFQEKRVQREIQVEEKKDRLINFEMTHLKLSSLEAIKKNNQWWDGNQLLSFNKFQMIEKKLSQIVKIKKIDGNWSQYSTRSFDFEINHIPWSVGDLSIDKQSFYLKKGHEIFLAQIKGESHHLTDDEKEISAIKLNELLLLLSPKRIELKENQLFRFFPEIPLNQLVIKTDSMVPFEIDTDKNETIPPPIPGISVHQELKKKIMLLLTQATIKEEIPFSDKLKGKKISEVVFSNQNSVLTWELWLKNDQSADAILIEPVSRKSFLMVGGTLKLFFVQIQDYWDKKVIPSNSFVSFKSIPVKFSQGSKEARVTILNKEPLQFEAKGFKIDSFKMEELFQIIFNLGPRDQAQRVSILSRSERKQFLSENHLRIEVMGQDLVILRKLQELIVVNLTQGFKAHFTMLNENFLGTFEDVLK